MSIEDYRQSQEVKNNNLILEKWVIKYELKRKNDKPCIINSNIPLRIPFPPNAIPNDKNRAQTFH